MRLIKMMELEYGFPASLTGSQNCNPFNQFNSHFLWNRIILFPSPHFNHRPFNGAVSSATNKWLNKYYPPFIHSSVSFMALNVFTQPTRPVFVIINHKLSPIIPRLYSSVSPKNRTTSAYSGTHSGWLSFNYFYCLPPSLIFSRLCPCMCSVCKVQKSNSHLLSCELANNNGHDN